MEKYISSVLEESEHGVLESIFTKEEGKYRKKIINNKCVHLNLRIFFPFFSLVVFLTADIIKPEAKENKSSLNSLVICSIQINWCKISQKKFFKRKNKLNPIKSLLLAGERTNSCVLGT